MAENAGSGAHRKRLVRCCSRAARRKSPAQPSNSPRPALPLAGTAGMPAMRLCLLRQGDQPAGGKGKAARLCLLPLLRQQCPSLWRSAPVRQPATADRSRRCGGLAGSAAAPPEPRHDRGRVRAAPASGPTPGSQSPGSRHRRSADRQAAPRHRPAHRRLYRGSDRKSRIRAADHRSATTDQDLGAAGRHLAG